uniref:Uncharacterized protein n=1 Tax=Timema monikensis TaxID=170555 RepID=A0A7R9HML8_9NEOP|nr:unnamed protein product [Timema monikensis]
MPDSSSPATTLVSKWVRLFLQQLTLLESRGCLPSAELQITSSYPLPLYSASQKLLDRVIYIRCRVPASSSVTLVISPIHLSVV